VKIGMPLDPVSVLVPAGISNSLIEPGPPLLFPVDTLEAKAGTHEDPAPTPNRRAGGHPPSRPLPHR